jgi:hypothetical protein
MLVVPPLSAGSSLQLEPGQGQPGRQQRGQQASAHRRLHKDATGCGSGADLQVGSCTAGAWHPLPASGGVLGPAMARAAPLAATAAMVQPQHLWQPQQQWCSHSSNGAATAAMVQPQHLWQPQQQWCSHSSNGAATAPLAATAAMVQPPSMYQTAAVRCSRGVGAWQG